MKIAITGEIRSGKDTVSDYIIHKTVGCQKLYFAEGIEEIIRRYFPRAFDTGKPRRHFQEIGTFMRTLDPEVWINRTEHKYRSLANYGTENFILTDLRKMNEYQWLKNNEFTVIKVETAMEIRKERAEYIGDVFDENAFNHESEREIRSLPYDYLVTNNDTEESLYEQIDFILDELEGEEHDAK